MEKEMAIQELVKRGALEVSELQIVSVTPSASENGTRVAITLNKAIPAFVKDDNDEFIESTSKQIFVFFGTIVKVMCEDTSCAKIAPYLKTNVLQVCSLLSGAKIKVMCENVEKDDEYRNPFSDNDVTNIVKRTTIFHHVTDIALDEDAKEDIKDIRKEIRQGVIKFNPE